jgi:hypothetical protein
VRQPHEHHGRDEDGLPMSLVVALWDARGWIAAVVFAVWGYAIVCRRYPYIAVFIAGFVRGLTRR